MTVYSKIVIAGSEVKVDNIQISKSTSENNMASNFVANINNAVGRYSERFTVGDNVTIYADKDVNPPTTKIFDGILETPKYQGSADTEKIRLSGRDYTVRMMDRAIEPEVYSNKYVGSIVQDIMQKYTDDISASGVPLTNTILERISFKNISVYDGIKNLAEQSDSIFYINEDKELIFEPKNDVSSGKTFNNTNILKSTFTEKRDTVFNEIWVYGDRYLDGYEESFVGTGSTSEYTLLYKPHNSKITIDGNIMTGAIENMVATPTSGINYLVNYDDKKITFVSGTDIGYSSIPGSNADVVMDYKRLLPIVKVGRDNASIFQYKKRVKTIVDKDIKDPLTAEQRLSVELIENSMPKKQGDITVKGVVNITPSQTCIVDVPFHNVNNKEYMILEARYNFNRLNNQKEDVLSLKLNKKLVTATDTIKSMMNAINKIQGGDIDDSDTLTRYEISTGSVGLKTGYSRVFTNNISGNSMIWDNNSYGTWGTQKWGAVKPSNEELHYAIQGHNIYNEDFKDTSFKAGSTTATWNNDLSFTSGQIAESTAISFNDGSISRAKLAVVETSGTFLYDMTADGTNWESATNNSVHIFANTGEDLRWRSTESGGGIGIITGVTISDYK